MASHWFSTRVEVVKPVRAVFNADGVRAPAEQFTGDVGRGGDALVRDERDRAL